MWDIDFINFTAFVNLINKHLHSSIYSPRFWHFPLLQIPSFLLIEYFPTRYSVKVTAKWYVKRKTILLETLGGQNISAIFDHWSWSMEEKLGTSSYCFFFLISIQFHRCQQKIQDHFCVCSAYITNFQINSA